jgi:hypothetical protein
VIEAFIMRLLQQVENELNGMIDWLIGYIKIQYQLMMLMLQVILKVNL